LKTPKNPAIETDNYTLLAKLKVFSMTTNANLIQALLTFKQGYECVAKKAGQIPE
jgi:hypothetical protein